VGVSPLELVEAVPHCGDLAEQSLALSVPSVQSSLAALLLAEPLRLLRSSENEDKEEPAARAGRTAAARCVQGRRRGWWNQETNRKVVAAPTAVLQ